MMIMQLKKLIEIQENAQWAIPIVTKRFIEYAHKENKFVHVWTIDKKSEMEELIELGVDGLMTDKPSTLMKLIKE